MSGGIEFWRAHVEACRREGAAARGYAQQHGLTLSSFYYWRKKLTPATALAGGPAGKFVALRVMEGTSGAAMVPCTLVLCSGLRLELAALPSPTWLLALDLAHAGAR